MPYKIMPYLARGLHVLLLFAAVQGVALAQRTDQQELVDAADQSLSNLLRDPNMSWLQYNFDRAKAVMIAPVVVKAGFIFGGSGGRAVTLARDPHDRQVVRARVLHPGHGKRRLSGGHLGIRGRDAGDDGEGAELIVVAVGEAGRRCEHHSRPSRRRSQLGIACRFHLVQPLEGPLRRPQPRWDSGRNFQRMERVLLQGRGSCRRIS